MVSAPSLISTQLQICEEHVTSCFVTAVTDKILLHIELGYWTFSSVSKVSGYGLHGHAKVKVKIKLSLCFLLTDHHVMKAYCGSISIAPRIFWLQH